ncbi:MAG: hypothetical protein Q7T33_05125 [Dehalococcoidia bacterium]|nr:hypothetical protein [Dehalococcoidia bacterium]
MIPSPLAARLAWRRVVAMSPLLRGYTSSPLRPWYSAVRFGPGARIVFGVALLAAAITAFAPAPAVYAQPGDERAAPRLLIAEMEALTAGAGKLSGAVRKADFETAQSQLATINRNWPAVRAELQRREKSDVINSFESALGGLSTAIEAGDEEAATVGTAQLQRALGAVNETLGSADLDAGRILGAVGLPLLIIAAITAVLPAAGRRIGVKL